MVSPRVTDLEWCIANYDRILFGPHPGVERHAIGDHRLLRTSVAHPLFNCVFSLGQAGRLSSTEMDSIRAWIGDRPSSWWLRKAHEKNFQELFAAHRFSRAVDVSVAARASEDRPVTWPSGFEVSELPASGPREEFRAVLRHAYQIPEEGVRLKDEAALARTHIRQKTFLVRETASGAAVAFGSVAIFPEREELAALTGAVTLPAYRGRGLYSALLRERLAVAARMGAREVFLLADRQSSLPIVAKLGFKVDCAEIVLYHRL